MWYSTVTLYIIITRATCVVSQYDNLREVEVGGRVSGEVEVGEQLRVSTLQQLVEDVEVPLALCLVHNSGLLQEIVVDVTSHRGRLCMYTYRIAC